MKNPFPPSQLTHSAQCGSALSRLCRHTVFTKFLALGLGFAVAGLSAHSAQAASATWTGATNNLWSVDTNWTPQTVPGTGDTATFNNAGNGNTTIDLGTGQAAAAVVFDTTSAAAYTIGAGGAGSQTLTLDNTGAVTMGLAAATAPITSQTINANVVLGTAAVGTTTVTNNATALSGLTLTFNGTVQGGTGGTASAKSLNTAGTGAVNFTGALSAGGSTGITFANTGTGTATVSGSAISAFRFFTANTGRAVVDGQTATVSQANGLGTSTGVTELRSGSLTYSAGISSSTSADAGTLLVTGGTFSASAITVARNFGNTVQPTSASGGLTVNGGTAGITGIFALGTSNSGSQSLVNGGALTVGGEVRIGAGSSSNRFNTLEVRSGSLTSTDATNGIVLSRAGAAIQQSQLLLTGGTTTAEKISFGTASTTTFAGSSGFVILTGTGSGASLYLGSGGLVSNSANITPTINLTAGTLGAKADWSSSLNMNLNGAAGTAVTIKAADVADVPHNITLNGVLSGNGGITKTGAGALTLNGTNTYTGATTVNVGRLMGNGTIGGAVTINSGGVHSPGTSPGVQTVNGNYTLNSGGALLIDVAGGGTTAGTDYDQVVTGAASTVTLGGGLGVNLTAVPTTGAVLTIINNSGPNIVGTFSNAPTDGATFNAVLGSTAYSFNVYYNRDAATPNTPNSGNDVLLVANGATTTAVKLISFEAKQFSNGMWVQWKTGLETDNVGFVLLRQDWMQGKGNKWQWSRSYRLHESLVAGSAAQSYKNADPQGGFSYGWKDTRPLPKSGRVRYILVDVDTDGKTTLHGPAMAAPAQGSLGSRASSPLLTQLGNR